MTVPVNMFPIHHHQQDALHHLAQVQHQGASLPLHEALNLGRLHHQQQEQHKMHQNDLQLQKHPHQFDNLEAVGKDTAPLDPLSNQQCRVCDEPAAGFHFGAFTCEGCKSFFGRTCNNQSVIQECKNNFRCVVDKKNRTACKACRLRKCLMVGMSKSGSRYGRRSNWFKIHCLMQNGGQQSAKRPPPPPPTSGRPSSERSMPATLSWPPLRPPTLPQPPKLPPVLHPSYSLMQALPGDLCQPKGSPPPSPPILKPSQEDTSPSNKTVLPSPPLPFPAHFYRHPLTNPLYRLSPLLTASSLLASNPLLFFQHKSHLEMIDEHRKLLLSFGISPLANLPSNKETLDDERDFDNQSEVKVDVDDMEKTEVEGDQEEIAQGDGEDDEDPVDLTTFKSSDQEALEKQDA